MKIRRAENNEMWEKLVEKDPYATFFHTPIWYEVARNYGELDGYDFFVLHIGDSRYGFPIGYRKILKGISKTYVSSPFGTYGGVLSDQEIIPASHLKEIRNWLLSWKSISFRDNPFRLLLEDVYGESSYTQAVKLKEVDITNIYKDWTKGHKSAAKKAIREGVTIRIAESVEDWDEYYAVYLDSIKRWGDSATSFYKKNLFYSLMEKEKIKLWLAFFDGRVISGCLCFYHNKHVVYWHGAALQDYFKLGSVHALQAELIKNALENGFLFYDFNPSGNHDGVVRFKKGFNTEFFPHQVLQKRTKLSSYINRLKNAL